jgi:excisionase family DNA binding protein
LERFPVARDVTFSPIPVEFVDPTVGMRIAGVGRSTFYALLRDGVIPRRKVGRRTLVAIADIYAWQQSLPITPPTDKAAGEENSPVAGESDV